MRRATAVVAKTAGFERLPKLKSTFNAENFIRSLKTQVVLVYIFSDFGAIHS